MGDGDAILWAGPGHQDYRDIRGVRTPYSARELARRALRDAGWPVPEPHWPVPYPTEPLPDPPFPPPVRGARLRDAAFPSARLRVPDG